MSGRLKNIVTNLIGLKLIGIDIYCYFKYFLDYLLKYCQKYGKL